MKEGIVHSGSSGEVTINIIETPIPEPKHDEVLVRVVVLGSNPKDWKMPEYTQTDMNSGDDVAGYVQKVGKDVDEFKQGDRVAALHQMLTPHGTFAEYTIAPAYMTFHLTPKVSLEDLMGAQGATIPLAAMTDAIGLYIHRKLPAPWCSVVQSTPLIFYGASSAVGSFAIKLAIHSNIHPIIAVGGRGERFVRSIIDESKGDIFVDYRDGEEKLVAAMIAGLRGAPCLHAYDAISEQGSSEACSKVLSEGGRITRVLPGNESMIPSTLKSFITNVTLVYGDGTTDDETGSTKDQVNGVDFGYMCSRLFGQGLMNGWLKPHPCEIAPGRLKGIPEALMNLRNGKASAVKYVLKIEDTP